MPDVGFVGIEGHDDIGVSEAGDGLHFPLKTLHKCWRLTEFSGEDLKTDDALHPPVSGLEHSAHSAGPNPIEHLIVADQKLGKPSLANGVGLEDGELARCCQGVSKGGPVGGGVRTGRVVQALVNLIRRPEPTVNQVLEKLVATQVLGVG